MASLIVFLSLFACGEGQQAVESGVPEVDPTRFVVRDVPDGFTLVTAGEGVVRPEWGEDSTGTDEPFTVVAPDGEAGTLARSVVVSQTGFAGYQGGLEQASAAYTHTLEELDIDGRRALFAEPGSIAAGASDHGDLVVERGDDLALRVRARGLAKDDAVAMARASSQGQRREDPPVVDPPDGFGVVGSVPAEAVVAIRASLHRGFSDFVPGPQSASTVAWSAGDGTLLAIAVPLDDGRGTVAALAAGPLLHLPFPGATARRIELDDRAGVLFENDPATCDPRSCPPVRILATTTPGDGLLVLRSQGESLLSLDELIRAARSAEPIGEAAWQELVIEATGGPGLKVDPDGVELARGRHGEVEWLFQAKPAELANLVTDAGASQGSWWPDACLKLSTRRRACAHQGGGGTNGGTYDYSADRPGVAAGAPDLPRFVIVTTTRVEGTAIRATVGEIVVDAPLHPLPGAPARRAALLFVDDLDHPTCPAAEGPLHGQRLEIVDGDGAVVACLGSS
jgi:hypothetical protein